MHGGLSDDEQQKRVERFGLADDPVRILFTGDVASEGVNLHRQCHHLVHYDIPWSLIRIEQRNGRIDRYGQREQPQFSALILTSEHDGAKDDRTVAETLLRREEEAYRLDGTAEAVTGYYRAEEEERRLVQELMRGGTTDDFLDNTADDEDDLLGNLFGNVDAVTEHEAPQRAEVPSLFDGGSAAFVDAALDEVFDDRAADALDLSRERDPAGGAYLSLSPAKVPDLLHRLKALPPSYLKDQGVAQRMLLTFDRDLATRRLVAARENSKTIWPTVSFLTDIHPFVEWLTDKLLVRFGRQEAPVITSPHVDGPVFLIQGMYSNAKGRPTVVAWTGVRGLPGAPQAVPLPQALAEAGVGPGLASTGGPRDLGALQQLVPQAVEFAAEDLEKHKAAWAEKISGPLADYRRRLATWQQQTLPGTTARRSREIEETVTDQQRLVDQLETTGSPLLRVLAVIDAPATREDGTRA